MENSINNLLNLDQKNTLEQKIQDEVIYSGIFLTEESKQNLKDLFPPKFPDKIFYHHTTNAFKPNDLSSQIGSEYRVKVIGIVEDDKGQAVIVENPYSKNPFPHITLSCSNEVGPVYSNELIKKQLLNGKMSLLSNSISINAIFGYGQKSDLPPDELYIVKEPTTLTNEIKERNKNFSCEQIANELSKRLEVMGNHLSFKHLDLQNEKDIDFILNPDSSKNHARMWHQWGVVTHTRMVEKAYRERAIEYKKIKGGEKIEQLLLKKIDGKEKSELIKIALTLHDLGKFTNRTQGKDGIFYFNNHELASRDIIQSSYFDMLENEYFLSKSQRDYIARIAETHYVFQNMREIAKQKSSYNMAFLQSEDFKNICKELKEKYPDVSLEIGVSFYLIVSVN